MKKEVIYYSGFSMGGLESCELLDNKKGKVFNHADEKDEKFITGERFLNLGSQLA